ncbi:MAG: erythromycin esterase family protein [Planctomycetota bacterium]
MSSATGSKGCYPKAKIVCWAATAHQAHRLKKIMRGGKPMYEGVTMAGEHAKNVLGNKLYTIGFIAHGGAAGLWTRGPFPVPQPDPDSVEAQLFRYGKPYLLVPLKFAPFKWPTHMAPMTYLRDLKANWSRVVDAVFYIEDMEPAVGLR